MATADRPYAAHITDRRTGETVVAHQGGMSWGESSEFWWSDGNYGCDCNRYLEFERAKGREPEFVDAKCVWDDFPNGKRFCVRIVADDNGEELYGERAANGNE